MSLLPKEIYGFNATPTKIPMLLFFFFFTETKPILKFTWNCKVSRTAKATLKKKKAGGLTHPDFKTFYKAPVIKTVWFWHSTDMKISETELTEINPRI